MPLSDSQLVGLMELVLLQQRDIFQLKASVFALAKVAYEVAGPEAGERILTLQKEFVEDPQTQTTRDTLELIEKAVLQLRLQGDPVN